MFGLLAPEFGVMLGRLLEGDALSLGEGNAFGLQMRRQGGGPGSLGCMGGALRRPGALEAALTSHWRKSVS